MDQVSIVDWVIQNQDKEGMLLRALERIIQLYTDKSHFIYELLQNAEDAGASRIKFEQYNDRLEVQHDGRPFTRENLMGLCDIGLSDKSDNLNQIGEFGVGFKSVFGICETVRLYSHPNEEDLNAGYTKFSVEIVDFTNPIIIEDQELDDGYTTKFVFPYCVGRTFSGFKNLDELNRKITNRLQNLGITTLLFMKNLKSVVYKIKRSDVKLSGSYRLNKSKINDHCSLVSAKGKMTNKDEEEKISYLTFSRPIPELQSGRSIDIAYAVSIKESGKFSFVRANSPFISVYFPTETESKLKFIVQGPYRTTPNRSSVPADDKDNIYLAEQTAKLFRDSIIDLRNMGWLGYSFMNILPMNSSAFETSPLFKCMFSATKELFSEENMLLCKDGHYASADSVKIARGNEFAEIMTDKLLTELINDGKDYYWLPTFITETRSAYKYLYQFLTEELKITVIRPEDLRNYFNENKDFLPQRDEEWLVRLYNLYDSIPNVFMIKNNSSNMATAEIIKTTKGTFVAAYRKTNDNDENNMAKSKLGNKNYIQNVFLPTENMDDFDNVSFVDNYVLEKCRHFFITTLNLHQPDEYEFFIQDFKRRYENKEHISEKQHISDLKNLLYYLEKNEYKKEVLYYIKKYIKLRCTQDGKEIFENPVLKNIYFPVNSESMSIEQYYYHIASLPFINLEFYKNWDVDINMLKPLGIIDDISIGIDEEKGDYYIGRSGRQPVWTSEGDFRWKLNLDHLDEVLIYISRNPNAKDSKYKSNFIFHFLQNRQNMLSGTVHISGNNEDLPNSYSDIVRRLRNDGDDHLDYWDGKWLYDKSGQLVSQNEITKNDLDPFLYGRVDLKSELYDLLGFRKNEEDQLKAAAEEYDRLDDDTKKQFLDKELKRLFNISVTDIEGNSTDDLDSISRVGSSDDILWNTYEFPSVKVKNMDALRKHAEEVLVYASPREYQQKIRNICVSRSYSGIRAYLDSMYEVDGRDICFCQMCHKPAKATEKWQIKMDLDLELDPMNLCLCRNCGANYRKMRANKNGLDEFINKIKNLDDQTIQTQEPVKIKFGNESIWFTQTHVAEIRELLILQDKVDNYTER